MTAKLSTSPISGLAILPIGAVLKNIKRSQMRKFFYLAILLSLCGCSENKKPEGTLALPEGRDITLVNNVNAKIKGPFYLDSIYNRFNLAKDTPHYVNLLNAFILTVENKDEDYNVYVRSTLKNKVYPDSTGRFDVIGNGTEEKAWIAQWTKPHESVLFRKDTVPPKNSKSYWFVDDFTMKADSFDFFFTYYFDDFGFRASQVQSYVMRDKKLKRISYD